MFSLPIFAVSLLSAASAANRIEPVTPATSGRAINLTARICPGPEQIQNMDNAELRRWLLYWDEFLIAEQSEVVEGEIRLSTGTAVDPSCFRGRSAQDRSALVDRFETVVRRVLEQNQRCRRHYEFVETDSIPGVLSRLRIVCNPEKVRIEGRTYGAVAHFFDDRGWSLLGKRYAVAGSDPKRRYRVELSFQQYFDNPNRFYSEKYSTSPEQLKIQNEDAYHRIYRIPLDEAAGVLFHELLHFLPTANQSWHNDSASQLTSGCIDSVFRDRVNFVQAVCFPLSGFGRAFWNVENGAATCEDVCRTALGYRDPSLVTDYAWLQGRAATAVPYPEKQIQEICRPHFGKIAKQAQKRYEYFLQKGRDPNEVEP